MTRGMRGRRHATGLHAAPRRRGSAWTAIVSVAAAATVAIVIWSAASPGGEPVSPNAQSDRTPTPSAAAESGVAESSVAVRISDDGTVSVEQRVAFRQPLRRLDLSVPERKGVVGTLEPRVDGITVVAGGRQRDVEAELTRGEAVSVRLPAEATEAVVSYVARGVARRDEPSRPERALLLATPVVLEQAVGSPARVDVVSVKALNVGCVDPEGTIVGCGTRTSSGWTVETTGTTRHVDVVVQVDLASP